MDYENIIMGSRGFSLSQVGMFYNYEKRKKNQKGTEEMAQPINTLVQAERLLVGSPESTEKLSRCDHCLQSQCRQEAETMAPIVWLWNWPAPV